MKNIEFSVITGGEEILSNRLIRQYDLRGSSQHLEGIQDEVFESHEEINVRLRIFMPLKSSESALIKWQEIEAEMKARDLERPTIEEAIRGIIGIGRWYLEEGDIIFPTNPFVSFNGIAYRGECFVAVRKGIGGNIGKKEIYLSSIYSPWPAGTMFAGVASREPI